MVTEAEARERAHNGTTSAIYIALTAARAACGWQPDAQFVASDFLSPGSDRDARCLPLSGTYQQISGASVYIQDWGGLASVRLARPDLIEALAARYSAPPPTHSFAASLLDYADLNGDLRLLGAEAAEYGERGLPPPRNRWPRTPIEAFDVLGWEALARPGFADLVGIGLFGTIAVNSAPRDLLLAMPELKADKIDILLERRASRPLEGSDYLRDFLQNDLANVFDFHYLAGSHVRVRSGLADAAPVMETSIRISETGTWPLWLLDYAIPTAQNLDYGTGNGLGSSVSPAGRDTDGDWLRSRR